MTFPFPAGFSDRMRTLLGEEWPAFAAAYERPLLRGLRVNTLKCGPERLTGLMADTLLAPTPFAPHSYYLREAYRAGADPLHHAGAYYMQEPSAMSAVTALDPRPGERVMDLCAAPGGKSTQIAAALRGEGLLWCNEYVGARARILCQNLERCGVRNAVVTSLDTAVLADRLGESGSGQGFFDAVLADAPCSGEGMFRKEPAALEQWSEDNIRLCARRQDGILDNAARLVRPGGRLLYSTCTFAPEENELAVARFLHRHPDFQLADLGGGDSPARSFGRPGFDWDRVSPFAGEESDPGVPLSRCRRLLPNVDAGGGEGHFLALFVREGAALELNSPLIPINQGTNGKMISELYETCFSDPLYGIPTTVGVLMRLLPTALPRERGVHLLSAGVAAAEIRKNRLEPCHALFMAADPKACRSAADLPLGDPRLAAFLRGEEIAVPGGAGYTAVCAAGVVTGFGKVSGGRLKNRYPKGLRLLDSR
jgi:16S rRNA C967 or C1407 C5-methylase (RsmB/RsmF family)/NOL1/NOP2/fmu family ribosome biogenesis protein